MAKKNNKNEQNEKYQKKVGIQKVFVGTQMGEIFEFPRKFCEQYIFFSVSSIYGIYWT